MATAGLRGRRSAVVAVGEVEPARGVPHTLLVPVRGDAASILDHPRHVHPVPREERRVRLVKSFSGPPELESR